MNKIISIILVGMFILSIGSVYAADGDVIWEKLGPKWNGEGVAVDSKDNIIVTGGGGTTKFDPNGNEVWASTILVYGNGVAVDSKDNIIVTSNNVYTMKLDPNGNAIWASVLSFNGQPFGGYGVVIDSNDNIIITGIHGTMKFDSNGNGIWASVIPFYGRGVAVDSNGNILVVDSSFRTRKYSPTGTFIWEKTFKSSGSSDFSFSVATDSLDNVIVSGYNNNPVSTWASIIVKYSPNGTKLWDITDDAEPRWSYGVAVDSYNNIIVAGGRYRSYDWLTKKYDPNGNKIWERAFDFKGGDDEGWAVAVDSKNDIIVTGWVYDGYNYYYTVKYQGGPPKNKSLPIAWIMKNFGLGQKE